MMSFIFTGLIFISIVFGVLNGQMAQVTNAAINESAKAVELMLKLMGTMCLWGGLMNVADKAGLTEKISNFFSPLTMRLFKGLKSDSAALKAISMNMTANLLGLGNAATPLGISAMTELNKEAKFPVKATNDMILFVVLNTASLQLIPTTISMLRLNAGSKNPMEIIPAIWFASMISVISGIIMAKLLSKVWG